MEYRKELKFIIKESDWEILKVRIKNLMTLDTNINEEQYYNVRSLYFDDYNNTFYHENEAGIDERIKIRLRIYNKALDIIKLEIKYKNNGLTKKESCIISKEMAEKLIEGKNLCYSECSNKVLKKIYLEQQINFLKPKIIVEYDRFVFTNLVGNVRITFDKNIRTSKYINRFGEDDIYNVPILDDGSHILEVKYDELLPDYIAQVLELNTLNATAFSKYYLSRLQLKEEVV